MKNMCVQYVGSFPNRAKQKTVRTTKLYRRDTEIVKLGKEDEKIDLEIAPMPSVDLEEEAAAATETIDAELGLYLAPILEDASVEVDMEVEVFEGLHDIYLSKVETSQKWNYSVEYIGNYFDNSSFVVVNNNVSDLDYKNLGMVPEHARYLESQLNYLKMYVGNLTEQPVYDVKLNKSVIPMLDEQSIKPKQESSGQSLSVALSMLIFVLLGLY